ncbi:adenosylmehtionine-8-amino-7-oxononanoate aminotransferase, partial [Thalassiosira pseudonana CCMP1335]
MTSALVHRSSGLCRHVSRRCLPATSYHRLLSSPAASTSSSSDDSHSNIASTNSPCACPSPSTCPNACRSLLDIDRHHVLHPYTSMTDPLPTYPVASAQGVHLTLNDGRQLIDGMSSWWAAVHGYRHAVLDAAMKKQLEESMSHVMFGGLTHRPGVELAGRLLHYHFTKVFYSDSGSVSVEVAMKMALQYWFTLHQRNNSTTSHDSNASNCTKTKFLSLRNGYHGDTFGAMSICDPVNGMHSMFSGMLAQQLFVPSPSGPKLEDAIDTLQQMEQMLQRYSGKVAAVVMEPIVQGAGGMKFYHPTVLRRVRELCDEHNVLLIFDEIATGFGRTGTLFAGGVVYPDILCLGKALTGGYMTLGATITTDKLAHGISDSGGVFMHGPTFMGNPLACSVALASLNLLMDSPWQERVQSVEKSLIRHLSPLADLSSKVREVRVLGAIGVCELHKELDRDGMARVQRMLVKEGVWLRPFGKLLYTMPPF